VLWYRQSVTASRWPALSVQLAGALIFDLDSCKGFIAADRCRERWRRDGSFSTGYSRPPRTPSLHLGNSARRRQIAPASARHGGLLYYCSLRVGGFIVVCPHLLTTTEWQNPISYRPPASSATAQARCSGVLHGYLNRMTCLFLLKKCLARKVTQNIATSCADY